MISLLKKALIWQAICSCGKKLAPYINKSTLSSQIYVKECLQERHLPLIKLHDNGPVLWHDLASCHYGKLTMESCEQNDVTFVPKTANPPNCPELRTIEKYWAIIKQKMKKKKLCRNIKDLKTSCKKASNSYDCSAVCNGNHQSKSSKFH